MLSFKPTFWLSSLREDYTGTSPDGQHWNQIDYILCSRRWKSSIQSAKTRLGADCGSDHALLTAKFRLKLNKVGKTTRPFRYAAAAKSLQSCPTLCDPIDGSHRDPPSMGFSRQEHWSGLPFPSPMHESEKWKWSCSVMSNSWRPHGLQLTRLLCPWDFPGKVLE